MPSAFADILRRHSRPLTPVPTGRAASPAALSGVRAVLFDLYGTLFISASGEVGAARQAACRELLAEALAAVGIDATRLGDAHAHVLFDAIEAIHAEGRAQGTEYPEVQIAEAWGRALDGLARRGVLDGRQCRNADLRRLAVEFEARANPVWPMPGAAECLAALRVRGTALGIVSNAQFYTPELFPACFGAGAEDLGFDPRLTFYSYSHGLAKPGTALFQMAAAELARQGIAAHAAAYVGNDVLNDVLPARQAGFRAVLFAGDARSLRLREDDPRVAGCAPDAVIASLADLVQYV